MPSKTITITRKKDRLRQKLNALVPGINDAINAANQKSATELASAVKAVAPVGPTGEYKASINAKPVSDTAGRADQAIRTTTRVRGRFGRVRTVGARATETLAWGLFANYIWRYLEFGTRKMTARPHIMGTYRSLRKRFKGRLARGVNKRIKQVARR